MEYLLLASLCLAAPAIVDWITQAWGLRESTNRLRLVTGFLEGVGAALLALLTIPLTYKITLLASIGASVLFIGRIANGWSVQGSLFSPNGRAHQK